MKKLLRRKHGDIAGVCGGIAYYFNIDELIVKILFVIGIFIPIPIILIYIVLWIFIPKDKL